MADLLDLARKQRAARIAELNDALRTTFQGGKVFMTAGINALADDVKADVLRQNILAVRRGERPSS